MTDDHMNEQPNDAIQDERIRALAAGHYNAPDGSVPRDAMWSQISAARRVARAGVAPVAAVAPAAEAVEQGTDVIPMASRRRTRTIVVWRWSAAVAAGLLLAFAFGLKYGQLSNTTLPVKTAVNTPATPERIDPPLGAPEHPSPSPTPNGGEPSRSPRQNPAMHRSSEPLAPSVPRDLASADTAATTLYRAAAVQTLVQAEAVLTAYRGVEATGRDPQAMQQAARWARDVLSSTRLLIDSPAGRDPQMRALFTDLELVLAQIVQLSGTPLQDSERDLIDRAMRDRDLLPRLRSAVPAGSATS